MRTTQPAVGERLGRAVLRRPRGRRSRPSGRRRRAPGASVSQPWSATSRPSVESSSCGSRSSGCAAGGLSGRTAADGRRRRRAGVAARRRAPAGPASGRCCGPGRGRRRRAPAAASAGVRARPAARRGGRSVDTGCTFPSTTSMRAPAQRRGTSSGDRGGDQHLLGAGDQLGQLLAALGVELGEDVVEDQDRVVAVGAQQVVGRQPQRERERPGLAVAGVALDRQRRRASASGRRGAGRPG